MLGLAATIALFLAFFSLIASLFRYHQPPRNFATVEKNKFDDELIDDLMNDKVKGVLGG